MNTKYRILVLAAGLTCLLPHTLSGQAPDCNGNGVPDALDLTMEPEFISLEFSSVDIPFAITAQAVDQNGNTVPFDWNGDGQPDLAVANHSPGEAVIHLNTGGDFTNILTHSTGGSAWSVVAGDLDADGNHDLVLLNNVTPGLLVFLNTNGGALTAPTSYLTNVFAARDAAIADLDSDGDLDLAVTHFAAGSTNALTILANTGSGSFMITNSYEIPSASSVAADDFDNDTDIDLALKLPEAVELWLNDGTGAFPERREFAVGAPIYSLIVLDADQDGLPDVAAASQDQGAVLVFRKTGSAQLAAPLTYPVPGRPGWLVALDLDQDGDPDLAGCDGSSGPGERRVVWLRNIGDGTFAGADHIIAGFGDQAPAITGGDLDGDGDGDLAVVGGLNQEEISILRNDLGPAYTEDCNTNGIPDECEVVSPPAFLAATHFPAGTEPVAIQTTAIDTNHQIFPLDLDGDGFNDIATGNEGGNVISILLNAGADTNGIWLGFAAPVEYPTGEGPTGLAAGDLDGDGFIDLVGASVLEGDIDVLYGTNNGGFTVTNIMIDSDNSPDVTIADFNANGLLDIAATAANEDAVFVVFNEGQRILTNAQKFAVGTAPRGIAHGDVDEDGLMDIVTANTGGPSISILRNDENNPGQFKAQSEMEVGQRPFHVAVADLNDSAGPEIIVADEDGNQIVVFRNFGSGLFGPSTSYEAGSRPRFVKVGDLNEDGRPDLAVANRDSNDVSVLLNGGSLRFSLATPLSVGSLPGGVASGDFDGDDRIDLASANQFDDTVSVLLLDSILPSASPDLDNNGVLDVCEGSPFLRIELIDGEVLLHWERIGTLQRSGEPHGEGWMTVPEATSPWPVQPTNSQEYYRLRLGF